MSGFALYLQRKRCSKRDACTHHMKKGRPKPPFQLSILNSQLKSYQFKLLNVLLFFLFRAVVADRFNRAGHKGLFA